MTRTLPTPTAASRRHQHRNAFDIHKAQRTRRQDVRVKYAVEAIGTFFLVATIGATAHTGSPLAPLAIGAVLMAMIYAGGHVSGAHYNPAVTLAVLVRGRITVHDAVGYCSAQVAGGLVAAAGITAGLPRTPSAPMHIGPAAMVAELLVTFALCYVVLNVATSKDHPDNGFYGLAIGFTVLAGAIAVGGISGGAFNPAVVLAGVAMGQFGGSAVWLYLPVQLLAGAAAAAAFRVLNPGDKYK